MYNTQFLDLLEASNSTAFRVIQNLLSRWEILRTRLLHQTIEESVYEAGTASTNLAHLSTFQRSYCICSHIRFMN